MANAAWLAIRAIFFLLLATAAFVAIILTFTSGVLWSPALISLEEPSLGKLVFDIFGTFVLLSILVSTLAISLKRIYQKQKVGPSVTLAFFATAALIAIFASRVLTSKDGSWSSYYGHLAFHLMANFTLVGVLVVIVVASLYHLAQTLKAKPNQSTAQTTMPADSHDDSSLPPYSSAWIELQNTNGITTRDPQHPSPAYHV